MQTEFTLKTGGPGLYEMTNDISDWLGKPQIDTGLLTLFVRHTSCSLVIQENADLDVQRDLQAFFQRFAPSADNPAMSYLIHRAEGPDDMPAHIKASVLPTSLSIPVVSGRMALGTWQGIYLFEHRDAPHMRRIIAHLSG
ncbi:MAG: secondary thiamine-phosphate synthase enzyme YjbQ [Pseudomonadota bacterium]